MQANGMAAWIHPAQAVLLVKAIEAVRAGLRSRREHMSSTVMGRAVRSCACAGFGEPGLVRLVIFISVRASPADPSLSSREEQLPAMGCCSIASRTMGLYSTARR